MVNDQMLEQQKKVVEGHYYPHPEKMWRIKNKFQSDVEIEDLIFYYCQQIKIILL